MSNELLNRYDNIKSQLESIRKPNKLNYFDKLLKIQDKLQTQIDYKQSERSQTSYAPSFEEPKPIFKQNSTISLEKFNNLQQENKDLKAFLEKEQINIKNRFQTYQDKLIHMEQDFQNRYDKQNQIFTQKIESLQIDNQETEKKYKKYKKQCIQQKLAIEDLKKQNLAFFQKLSKYK